MQGAIRLATSSKLDFAMVGNEKALDLVYDLSLLLKVFKPSIISLYQSVEP